MNTIFKAVVMASCLVAGAYTQPLITLQGNEILVCVNNHMYKVDPKTIGHRRFEKKDFGTDHYYFMQAFPQFGMRGYDSKPVQIWVSRHHATAHDSSGNLFLAHSSEVLAAYKAAQIVYEYTKAWKHLAQDFPKHVVIS